MRYLGVSDYGILGFAISFTGLFGITMDFGISTHIVRNIATDYNSAEKYLGNAVPLKSILALFSFIVVLISLIILKANIFTIFITLLFTFEAIIKSMCGLFFGTFQAFEMGKYQAIANITLNILTLIFILITIFTDYGLFGITIAYLAANIIVLIYSYLILVNKVVIPKLQFNLEFYKKLIIWGTPFALTSFFYVIYYSIDIVMLQQIAGSYAVGIYNASYKLINVLTLFYSIYTAVVFPVMSKFFKNEKKLLKISFEKSIKYLMMITIPIAVGTVFYGSDIISLIDNKYALADSVLQILIWTVCFLFINGACSTLLNASHKEVSVTKIYGIAAIFNVILNFILIPSYSFIGASVATVLSEVLILVLAFYMLYKINQLPNKKLYIDIFKICMSSLILAIILQLIHVSFLVAIPISIVVYLIALILTKSLDSDDKYILNEILDRN